MCPLPPKMVVSDIFRQQMQMFDVFCGFKQIGYRSNTLHREQSVALNSLRQHVKWESIMQSSPVTLCLRKPQN